MNIVVLNIGKRVAWVVGLGVATMAAELSATTLEADRNPAAAPVPVIVGEVEDLDACLGLGTVKDLKHSLLAVRSGPGSHYPQLDELDNGRQVFVCTSNADKVWLGVVYAPVGSDLDCGVSSPRLQPEAYGGPCRSGWVHHRWLDTGE
ncbi:integron [Ahniella affigens]|uniref:Integron n=1 Tax=Ahniella affigens TaxID=2021234 RepID=A0A2P1PUA1_9GAMM|nr:integron [Ahniella affigens]AVP98411.1 integron [Ahniella affigens]